MRERNDMRLAIDIPNRFIVATATLVVGIVRDVM